MDSETKGTHFILLGSMVRADLTEDLRSYVDSIDPDGWYPSEKLLEIMQFINENLGRERTIACGKAVYYTLKEEFAAMGVKTPMDALMSIVVGYAHNNRGADSGGWQVLEQGENRIRLENRTFFWRTGFDIGVVTGAVKAFGGRGVVVDATEHHEDGKDFEVIEVSWTS